MYYISNKYASKHKCHVIKIKSLNSKFRRAYNSYIILTISVNILFRSLHSIKHVEQRKNYSMKENSI